MDEHFEAENTFCTFVRILLTIKISYYKYSCFTDCLRRTDEHNNTMGGTHSLTL